MIFDILQYNNECSPIKFNKEFLQEEHGPQSFHNQQYPTIIPMFTLSIFWHCHISILNAIQYQMYKNNLHNVWHHALHCTKDSWTNTGGNGCLPT